MFTKLWQMSELRKVSIVIPCRNEELHIGKCLQSVVQSDYDKSLLSVFVCDVERIRPQRHQARVYLETRSGIEHFSTDLETAKLQLARTTLLQMVLSPSMIHLVSYCEANHAATAEDVIESSMLVRRAVRLFNENEPDLKKYMDHPIVLQRKEHLLGEAQHVLTRIAALSSGGADLCKSLSNPDVLYKALQNRIMTAPGITHPDYLNTGMLTKPNKYGFMDCYEQWEDVVPIREDKRLSDTLD